MLVLYLQALLTIVAEAALMIRLPSVLYILLIYQIFLLYTLLPLVFQKILMRKAVSLSGILRVFYLGTILSFGIVATIDLVLM